MNDLQSQINFSRICLTLLDYEFSIELSPGRAGSEYSQYEITHDVSTGRFIDPSSKIQFLFLCVYFIGDGNHLVSPGIHASSRPSFRFPGIVGVVRRGGGLFISHYRGRVSACLGSLLIRVSATKIGFARNDVSPKIYLLVFVSHVNERYTFHRSYF